MKIYDLFVSSTSDRVISASADQTCKVWYLDFLIKIFNNNFLFKFWSLLEEDSFPTDTILLESAPSRCLLDNLEEYLYLGMVNGDIIRLSIKKVKL
jgi:hypothetical protein